MKSRVLILSLLFSLITHISFPAFAATKPGTKCTKKNATKVVFGTTLKCQLVKGKLIWVAQKKASSSASQEWQESPGSIVQEQGAPNQQYSPEKTVKINGVYRSYFVSKISNSLVYNESTDGVTYTNQVKTNLVRSREFGTDTTLLDHPVVLPLKNGKFLLVYDICTGNCDVPPSLPRRLVSRISDDGISWGPATYVPGPGKSGLNPEGKVFDSVPSLVQLASGVIRLYYVQGGAAVGSAISKDNGSSWEVEDGFRLGTPYGIKPKTESFIDPVIFLDTDGTFYLYFGYVTDWGCMESGGTPKGCVPIRVARSTDGLNFKMDSRNILNPGPGATQFGDPDIFIGPDGKWRMLYASVQNNTQFTSVLKVAVRNK